MSISVWISCLFRYQISRERVRSSEVKIKTIRKFSIPKSLKKLQSFVGLTGYLWKFVECYAVITRPLTNLLKLNRAFKFENKEMKAFKSRIYVINLCWDCILWKVKQNYTLMHARLAAILLQKSAEDFNFHLIFNFPTKNRCSTRKYYCRYCWIWSSKL